jgi:BirA family biotin operon repressor/biotin-[acetyl-CoA-carboxylase] ligase
MDDSLAEHGSGWPFVKTTIGYDTIDSTSDRAARFLREASCALPLLVWARRQTLGRGRRSHAWWSDDGSLTFTVAIDPSQHGLSVADEPKLALGAAVAVIEALDDLELGVPSLGIRWPNDLEVEGRKLGGILPERVETTSGHRVLIGIGLNVRTELAAAPPEIRAMATSLAAVRPERVDEQTAVRLMAAILDRFGSVLERMVNGDPSLHEQWNRLDLLRDTWVCIDQRTHHVAGRGQGIDHDGALCVDDGRQQLRILGGQVLRTNRALSEHSSTQAE